MHAHVQPLAGAVHRQQVVAAGTPAAILAGSVQQRPALAEAGLGAAEVGAVDVAVVRDKIEGVAQPVGMGEDRVLLHLEHRAAALLAGWLAGGIKVDRDEEPSPQMLAKLRGRDGGTMMLQQPAAAVTSSVNLRVFRSTTVTDDAGVAFCTNSRPPSELCCR